jgi:protein-tyrosine phosphatase
MLRNGYDKLIQVERGIAERLGAQRFVDVHCHCLPTIDDGPATKAETLALCRALVDDCVATVIATPHQLGRFGDANEAVRIREEVSILNKELKQNNISLTVLPGGDVRVDERICQLLEADKVLTIADRGKYILLELPYEISIDIEPLILELSRDGIRAIISHPERHKFLVKRPEFLSRWLECGAVLQVTAGSLLGDFGRGVQSAAWSFMHSGWAKLVATDSHNVESRKPCMTDAFVQISIRLGRIVAEQVCIENPLKVLKNQDIAVVYTPGLLPTKTRV